MADYTGATDGYFGLWEHLPSVIGRRRAKKIVSRPLPAAAKRTVKFRTHVAVGKFNRSNAFALYGGGMGVG